MAVLFFSAFAMALAFAIQPGPIGFESLRRGVSHGWTAALHVELGSLVGDGVWAAIALLGASILFQNRLVTLLLGLFGCGLLLRFAWDAWRASRHELDIAAGSDGRSNHFVAGALISLSNPQKCHCLAGCERNNSRLRLSQSAAAAPAGVLFRLHDRASLLVLLFRYGGGIRPPLAQSARLPLD